jgi:hypothetical protein
MNVNDFDKTNEKSYYSRICSVQTHVKIFGNLTIPREVKIR